MQHTVDDSSISFPLALPPPVLRHLHLQSIGLPAYTRYVNFLTDPMKTTKKKTDAAPTAVLYYCTVPVSTKAGKSVLGMVRSPPLHDVRHHPCAAHPF